MYPCVEGDNMGIRVKTENRSRRTMGFAVYHKPTKQPKRIYLWVDDTLPSPAIALLIRKVEELFSSLTTEEIDALHNTESCE